MRLDWATRLSDAEVLDLYPDLRPLMSLKHQGWQFKGVVLDGEPVLLASKPWPDSIDAVWVFDRDNTIGLRQLDDAPGARGGPVWRRIGNVGEVAEAILQMPAPGMLGAPRLVLPSSMQTVGRP